MKKKILLENLEQQALTKLKILSKKIIKHNKLYHKYDKPEISDQEFDKLIEENNLLEKKFPNLILKNSPNKIIGSPISNKFLKVKHKEPMLSLSNAFNDKDIEDFIKRVRKYLKDEQSNLIFLCEPKIDGLSINLTYNKGKLTTSYFAPMSALQIGLIYERKKNFKDAGTYFKKCIKMSGFDYERGIHQKAKAGLDRIRN